MISDSRQQRIQTVCLMVLTALGIAVALRWMKPVLVPFVLALFFSVGLAPLIDLQVKHLRWPRKPAALVTLILGLLILLALGTLVSKSIAELAANADIYKARLAELLQRAAAALPLERFGVDPAEGLGPLLKVPVDAVGGMLVSTTGAIANILSNGLLVLIFMCFLLFGATGRERPATGVWGEIKLSTQRYIVTKMVLSSATGVLVGAVLWALGIELALVFGLMAFLLNFIPSIGSIIATLLPLPIVIVSPEVSATAAVLAIAGPGCIQFVIGNIIEPRIMGKSFDLHPIAILLSLIFWGVLWGVVGMFLAIPVTAVVKVLLAKNEMTAPVARMLAGRLEDETVK